MIDSDYLAELEERIRELEQRMTDLSVSGEASKLQPVMREHAARKREAEAARRFLNLLSREEEARGILEDEAADEELRDMAHEQLKEVESERSDAEKRLKIALLPVDAAEEKNTILEIRAGTGGDEAALFAADLYRMYCRYAELAGWKTGIISSSPSSIGGYKEIIFSMEGEAVFRTLQYESGVHRVQRVPETEASGRIHTSAATVAVLPEADEVGELDIKPDEIRVDVYRSSGPGGQSVNTTDSAVRITHIETGLIVQCQDEKSQHRNRDKAMRVLKARLLDRKRAEEADRAADARRSQIGSGDRSERIRTYNFPQNRLTDHRINLTLYSLDRVMEGELQDLLDALYQQDVESRIQLHLEQIDTARESDE